MMKFKQHVERSICTRITAGFRTGWQVETGRASEETDSEGPKGLTEAIIEEGSKESKKNSLEARGNTDTVM